MEPEGSLPYSQESATCPYPEPDQSSPCPAIIGKYSLPKYYTSLHHLHYAIYFFHYGKVDNYLPPTNQWL
jgi:hypothetical protein